MIDLRGFGFSGGHRGLAEIHELHEDIQILLNHISSELPLFLYGHGFGATLIVSLLMRNKWLNITGVILTSPLFGFAPEQKVNVFRRWVIRLSPEIFGVISPSKVESLTSVFYRKWYFPHGLATVASLRTIIR